METRRKVKTEESSQPRPCPCGKFKVGVAVDKNDFFRVLGDLTGSKRKASADLSVRLPFAQECPPRCRPPVPSSAS